MRDSSDMTSRADRRPYGRWWLLLVLFCWVMPLSARPDVNIDELKAAFVLRFVQFVDWPVDVFATTPQHSFVLCVYGDQPMVQYLRQASLRTRIDGRPLTVLQMQHAEDSLLCQAVFVSADNSSGLDAVLKATRLRPVLTISDSDVDEQGLMIRLFRHGDRLAFAIRPDDARASGLNISAQLLRLSQAPEPK